MKHFKDENWINSDSFFQVLKRKVTFEAPTKNAEAVLRLVDKNADEKFIKLLHNRKVSILKYIVLLINMLLINFTDFSKSSKFSRS